MGSNNAARGRALSKWREKARARARKDLLKSSWLSEEAGNVTESDQDQGKSEGQGSRAVKSRIISCRPFAH